MRFLVLSDIHGNRFGLEAVLAAATGEYDALLCLGDIVGYGAHPNECCALLRECSAQSLSGNHDAAALGLLDISWFNDNAAAAALWTRAQLTAENAAWLRRLPAQAEWPEYSFQAVHGSLVQPWEEYIVTRDEARPTLERMSQPLCFFGHTHVATVYECLDRPGRRYRLDETPLPHGGRIEMESEVQYLVNPGSCGQPRDRNPQARYAIFDTRARVIEVRPVDYDIEAARRAIYDAGLPPFLGDRLLQGR